MKKITKFRNLIIEPESKIGPETVISDPVLIREIFNARKI